MMLSVGTVQHTTQKKNNDDFKRSLLNRTSLIFLVKLLYSRLFSRRKICPFFESNRKQFSDTTEI